MGDSVQEKVARLILKMSTAKNSKDIDEAVWNALKEDDRYQLLDLLSQVSDELERICP